MRLDKFLSNEFGSRNKALRAIQDQRVLVNGKLAEASYNVKETDVLQILPAEEDYVSIGGFKLAKAIHDFSFDATGKTFIDVGASTGGFTDCLLKNNAKKIFCIDVGESQLDKKLVCDKVVIIDNFNARNLTKNMFLDKIDAAVVDVSFISLTYVLAPISNVLEEGGELLALIKPQFECESKSVGKNGILRDKKTHQQIVKKIYDYCISCGLSPIALTNAPIHKDKNLEYVIYCKKCEVAVNFDKLIKNITF